MIKKKPEWFIVISSFDFVSVKVERKETCSTVFETGKGAFVFPSFFFNVKMCLWIDIIIATLLMTYLPTRYSVLNFFMFRLLRVPQRSCIVFIK